MAKAKKNGKRVAIVAGLRTPFAKSSTVYKEQSALDLAKLVVTELVTRTGIDGKDIGQVVYGQVAPSVQMPNIAREIVLGTGLPQSIEAYSVSRACATSYQSTVNVVEAILAGATESGIAGGADSASVVPITVSKRLSAALVEASKARNLPDRLSAFRHLSPKDLLPVPPAIAEVSTNETMGQSCEKMAKENGISRADQDAFAHRSHTLAAAAWAEGRFAEQVMTVYVPPKYKEAVTEDNLVRKNSELGSYAKLRPAFDKKHGTITAGNASPLTDGASALLLMREDKARALGFDVLGFVRSYAFAALDPREQLLMGPAYATPIALDRAGLSLSDMDLVDMHEAFAAQILSNTQAFESASFAKEKLGRSKRIGQINWDTFNVTGGSLAIGHPFAATGARQITQTLHELKRRGGQFGLCTACAAGGLGAAMILETV
ncbi:MAG: acetyl-CoA C-acyltransferase FadI [Myxococcales bacterium]|nr:acetyl-CoA C-acyltransferase FadI [Myxococcales bacterium]